MMSRLNKKVKGYPREFAPRTDNGIDFNFAVEDEFTCKVEDNFKNPNCEDYPGVTAAQAVEAMKLLANVVQSDEFKPVGVVVSPEDSARVNFPEQGITLQNYQRKHLPYYQHICQHKHKEQLMDGV